MLVSAETIVNAPIKTVWEAFNDKAQSTQWVKALQRVESISGEPLTPGTQLRYIYKEGGRENVMLEEITAVDAPNRIDSVYSTKVMRSNHSFVFEDVGGVQTKITGQMQLQPTHFVMRMMLGFLKGSIRKRLQDDLERFSDLIDNNYATP